MGHADLNETTRSCVTELVCKRCDVKRPITDTEAFCPMCGKCFDVAYDYELAKARLRELPMDERPRNIWRLSELSPIRSAHAQAEVGQVSGMTPLIPANRLGARLGLSKLYLKDDSSQRPSFSYKDRVVSSAVARALELGKTEIGCVSTGNVGTAVAALAAKAVADQARATQLLPFKGGLMDGEVVDADQIRAISRLPSREVLYGQLVGIVASPISGLVRTLGGLVGGLAVALGQVREKKESGEIPAGEPPAGEAAPVEEAPAAEAPAAEAPVEEESAVEAPAVEEVPATDEAPVAEESAETPTEDAQAAEEGAAEEQPESEAEVASAAEASTTDQAEPATEPAQDDNQTDASEQEAESAEATKED
jgi:hypothetical protein